MTRPSGDDAAAPMLDVAEAARAAAADVLARLGIDDKGLSETTARERLGRYGSNVLAVHRVTAAGVLARQLRNPLLLLLVSAAVISGVTGAPTDAAIITTIVALSIGLGFANELRAERAAAALHSVTSHHALVTREGVERSVDVRELVPGDIVTLRIGDVVPADVRLLETTQLECDEAVLTGESIPVAKSSEPVDTVETGAGPTSCAFLGTIVHQGSGRAVVIATGRSTAFGAIASGLTTPPTYTAFQVGLRQFSTLLVRVAAVLTVSIFVINVVLSRPIIDALLFSLAIAIGITPQLLPAIVSVSLATGSRELARQRVLVKRLVTIEDIGNIQVLFTDKTGTLTQGTVEFDQSLDPTGAPADAPLQLALVCNEASWTADGPVGGNALDQALWRAPEADRMRRDATGPAAFERVGILPFDHDRQLITVAVIPPTGEALLITKGAPEVVLARCRDVPAGAADVMERSFDLGSRVIAIATRPASEPREPRSEDEHDLQLVGFLTFRDRLKPEAGPSVARLAALGVAVKVITGDNGRVAARICADIGLDAGRIITGTDLDQLDDKALSAAIPSTTVFARVSPAQKARIVSVARRSGDDVAFLGDGVNDAVALHAADVGISVDDATDVARDAADIVLLDKDLGVLANGVEEGRRIFANTMKYVLMSTSSNFGNMFSAAGASLVLSFLPMLPSQILLNNLLYDVGQLAIPNDRVDPETVARPTAWDIGFVRRFMTRFGPLSSLFDFATFYVLISVLHAGRAEFRTGWFIESLATQTLVVFLIRTRRVPFLRSRPSRGMLVTPTLMATLGAVLPFTPLAGVLGFGTLPLSFFLILAALTAAYLLLIEGAKSRFFARERARGQVVVRSHEERHARHVTRRARRFLHHARIPTRAQVVRRDGSPHR